MGLRFVAGVAAGIAFTALVAGAARFGAPTAAEPEAPPPVRADGGKASPAAAPQAVTGAKRPRVPAGVLARAASRHAKPPEARAPEADAAVEHRKEVVIESVEVDWGALPARP